MDARKYWNLLWCAIISVVAGCSGPPSPPEDLSAAVAVVGYLAGPRYINVSMYSSTAETGAPSEFVSYLFSSMGAAERPSSYGPQDAAEGRRGGPPSWPDGIGFYAIKPDPAGGKQVVVSPDDSRGIIIAEGYTDPSGKPLVRREFVMAKPIKQR